MIRQYKLDVRTVAMGIDLQPCAAPDLSTLCDRIRERLVHYSGRLRAVLPRGRRALRQPDRESPDRGQPIGWVAAGQRTEGLLAIAPLSTRWPLRSGWTWSAASVRWSRRAGPRQSAG